MSDFKFNQILFDSLNDEQKQLLNEDINHLHKKIQKENQIQISSLKEEFKKEWEQDLENKNIALQKQNEFLNSIPENNKDIISKLINKGIEIDDIKNDFKTLLEERPVYIDLNSIANKENEIINKDKELSEINKMKVGDIDINDPTQIQKYKEYKKKGLI